MSATGTEFDTARESDFDEQETADMPPVALEAERAVLGTLLSTGMSGESPDDVLEVAARLPVEALYRPAHQVVYRAILDLYAAGKVTDPITVVTELQSRGELARAGGHLALIDLMQSTPTATNVAHWAGLVLDAAARREALAAGRTLVQHAGSASVEVPELVERVRARLDTIAAPDAGAGVDLAELAEGRAVAYQEPVPPGMATGWHDLDSLLSGGLRAGQFVLVAARPGLGKSLVATALCLHRARMGDSCLLVSLEMSRDEIMDRIYASEGRIELDHLRSHALTEHDWQRLGEAMDRMQDWPLRIEDGMNATLSQIRALALRQARSPRGLHLLVIDYLQLMNGSGASRQEEISGISRGLKQLARELGVPVVALSQLNRGPEQRSDKRPQLSDLRESGSLEQDSDVVMLLWRDPEEGTGTLSVDVPKHRNGRTGSVVLAFAGHFAQIRSRAPDPD